MEEIEIRRTHGADPSVVNALKADLNGKRVLDVGCRDGLYSFMAERRGAAEVIAVFHWDGGRCP